MKNVGSMYIHIPFCNKICNYCDFSKMYYKKEWVVSYLKELMLEIDSSYNNDILSTLYVGGGTPSCLAMNELKALFNKINTFPFSDDYEFTFECNLEDINDELMAFLKKNRVNRLSIGVESFNKRLLDVLGRSYNFDIREKISLAKKYFDNINVDLIYAAYSDMDILKRDIQCVLELDVKHVSTYSLILEEHTVLKINGMVNIDEDIDYEMYKYIEDRLVKNGYTHYEISNYARDGFMSRHNLVYWNNMEYYGFGLSSTSYIDNVRRCNTKNINSYLEGNFIGSSEYEDVDVRMENEVMLGLRKFDGICLTSFEKKFGKKIQDVFNIDDLVRDGYLIIDDDFIKINKEYMYISNEIIVRMFK